MDDQHEATDAAGQPFEGWSSLAAPGLLPEPERSPADGIHHVPELAELPGVDLGTWTAAQNQINALESRLARAEEENRAFVQSLRHLAAVAEELIAEARSEAEQLRATAEREVAALRADLEQRRAAFVAEAEREAGRVIEGARAASHEMLIVARADAREAVHEERRRAAGELEMLAAVRERISDERRALTHFHTQLSGRLRQLVHAMLEFAEKEPGLAAGDSQFASTVLTGPALYHALEGADAAGSAHGTTAPMVGDRLGSNGLHAEDEHLDRAFEAFFSEEIDHEPSRAWILEDREG